MAERNSFTRQFKLAAAAALLSLLAACAGPAPEFRAAVDVKVKLLAFNDFHGYLLPPFSGVPQLAPDPAGVRTLIPAGGIEHLATLVTKLRAKIPRPRHCKLADEPHRFTLEPRRKSPSLHLTPPISFSHLSKVSRRTGKSQATRG